MLYDKVVAGTTIAGSEYTILHSSTLASFYSLPEGVNFIVGVI